MNDSLEELRAKARQQVTDRHANEVKLGTEIAEVASTGKRYTADIAEYLNLVLDRLVEDGVAPGRALPGTNGVELNYPLEKLRAAASNARWLGNYLNNEATRIETERNYG